MKKYLVKVSSYNIRYFVLTEKEIYERINWMNNQIQFGESAIRSNFCSESEFLKHVNNPIELMSLFNNILSIKEIC